MSDANANEGASVIYALTTSGTGRCYAGTDSGVYRWAGTSDDGALWHRHFPPDGENIPVTAVAVVSDPESRSDRAFFAGVQGGVARSLDGGAHWDIGTFPMTSTVVTALCASPAFATDSLIWAGTLEDGIFCSEDQGRYWYPWNFGLLDLRVLTLAVSPHFAADETIFAGTESGIYRSTNGGRAWREVAFPVEDAAILSLALSPQFHRDGTLFTGTESHGLFYTEDGGQNWTRLNEAQFSGPVNAVLLHPNFPARPLLVVLDGGTIWLSEGGERWQRMAPAYSDVVALAAVWQGDTHVGLIAGLADGSLREAVADLQR